MKGKNVCRLIHNAEISLDERLLVSWFIQSQSIEIGSCWHKLAGYLTIPVILVIFKFLHHCTISVVDGENRIGIQIDPVEGEALVESVFVGAEEIVGLDGRDKIDTGLI